MMSPGTFAGIRKGSDTVVFVGVSLLASGEEKTLLGAVPIATHSLPSKYHGGEDEAEVAMGWSGCARMHCMELLHQNKRRSTTRELGILSNKLLMFNLCFSAKPPLLHLGGNRPIVWTTTLVSAIRRQVCISFLAKTFVSPRQGRVSPMYFTEMAVDF